MYAGHFLATVNDGIASAKSTSITNQGAFSPRGGSDTGKSFESSKVGPVHPDCGGIAEDRNAVTRVRLSVDDENAHALAATAAMKMQVEARDRRVVPISSLRIYLLRLSCVNGIRDIKIIGFHFSVGSTMSRVCNALA
jgi:hypothetical protein